MPSVRYLPDTQNQNLDWLSSCCSCADLCKGHFDNVLRVLQISSNRLTFGEVTAKCVNTAKTRRKVNPIVGESIASSRIITERISHEVQYRSWTNVDATWQIYMQYSGTAVRSNPGPAILLQAVSGARGYSAGFFRSRCRENTNRHKVSDCNFNDSDCKRLGLI